MKQNKVNELSSLARSKTDIEDLTEQEHEFYNEHKFRVYKGTHKAVICNPSNEDKAMVKQICKKLRVVVTYIIEPDDNGMITRHKILST